MYQPESQQGPAGQPSGTKGPTNRDQPVNHTRSCGQPRVVFFAAIRIILPTTNIRVNSFIEYIGSLRCRFFSNCVSIRSTIAMTDLLDIIVGLGSPSSTTFAEEHVSTGFQPNADKSTATISGVGAEYFPESPAGFQPTASFQPSVDTCIQPAARKKKWKYNPTISTSKPLRFIPEKLPSKAPFGIPLGESPETKEPQSMHGSSANITLTYNQKVYIYAHTLDESNTPFWPLIGCVGLFQRPRFPRGTEYAEVQIRVGMGGGWEPDWMQKKTMEHDHRHVFVPFDMVYLIADEYACDMEAGATTKQFPIAPPQGATADPIPKVM